MSLDRDMLRAALPTYEIGDELGRGAFGIVLAGTHRQLGRQVAIKQLATESGMDGEVRARFLSEARVLASMDHPHIVPIFDFVEYEGACLLVMERLPGGTLWDRMAADGVDDRFACAVALAVAAGLEYAHRRKVLHRDIKPENLMFSGDGVLKVTDFGIAKVVGATLSAATKAGSAIGTPAYMAPEQALGQQLSASTDVYALGTVLYELTSGQLPYPAVTDPIASLYQHVHEDPRPIGEVAATLPRPIAAVIDRAIARSLDVRYSTAAAFRAALSAAVVQSWGPDWANTPVLPVHDIDTIPTPSSPRLPSPTVPDPAPLTVPDRVGVAPPTIPASDTPASDTPASAPPASAPAASVPPAVGPPPPRGPGPDSAAPRPPAPSRKWLVPAVIGAAVVVIGAVVAAVALRSPSKSDQVVAPAVTAGSSATTAVSVAPGPTVPARLARFAQASCRDDGLTDGQTVGTPTDFFTFAFHGQARGVTVCSDPAGSLTALLPTCNGPACTGVEVAVKSSGGVYQSRAGAAIKVVGPEPSGRTYSVDGLALSVFDSSGAIVATFAVTDSSLPPAAGSLDAVGELERLLSLSTQTRGLAAQLSTALGNCGISGPDAVSQIADVNEGRSEVLGVAQRLQALSPGTQVPVGPFVTAINDSLQSDLAWARWIKSQWVPYAASGCTGTLIQSGDPDFDTFTQLSLQATQDKQAFLDAFNPQAAARGLPSDWTPDHV